MKFCQTCGKEIMDEAIVCPNCGCAVGGKQNVVADEISVGFCILSALVPLFGIIYWAVKAKETPRRAKACGITGLVSWGVSLLLSCLFSATLLGSLSYLF